MERIPKYPTCNTVNHTSTHDWMNCVPRSDVTFVADWGVVKMNIRHRTSLLPLPAETSSRFPREERAKLQTLVYDILPPTTAIIHYVTGLRQLLANGQFFFGAQMAVRLQQTTQTILNVSLSNRPCCLRQH